MGRSKRGALDQLSEFKERIQANEQYGGPAAAERTIASPPAPSAGEHAVQAIPLNRIVEREGFNVRTDIPQDDEFAALVQGMADIGLLHPIVVAPYDEGRYAVVVGHRRLRAAHVLGWPTISAIVQDWDVDTQTRANYMENRHRASVSPYDDARRAVDIMDGKGWSLRKTAVYLGDSLGRLSALVRIYRNPRLRRELESDHLPFRWLQRLVVLLDEEGEEKQPGSVEAFLIWIAKETPSEARFLEALEVAKATGTLPTATVAAPTPAFDRVWRSTQKLGQLAEKYEATLSADELRALADSLMAQGQQLAEAARRRAEEAANQDSSVFR